MAPRSASGTFASEGTSTSCSAALPGRRGGVRSGNVRSFADSSTIRELRRVVLNAYGLVPGGIWKSRSNMLPGRRGGVRSGNVRSFADSSTIRELRRVVLNAYGLVPGGIWKSRSNMRKAPGLAPRQA